MRPTDLPKLDVQFDSIIPDGTPSEADGRYGDYAFTFYARFNWWGFAVSPINATDPFTMIDVAQCHPEKRIEHFGDAVVSEFEHSFVEIENEYGADEFAASYMPEQEMRRIIDLCLDRFDNWRAKQD